MERGLWIYPWDLLDGGIDSVVERLHNMGINVLSVATIYHNGRFLLPKRASNRVFTTSPGIAYFAPTQECYEDGWVPVQAAEASQQDLFPRLAAACAQRNMRLRAWTIGFHDQPRPGSKVVNVLGDEYGFALCPSVPANREYLASLVADIGSTGFFDVIDLESYGYHGYRHHFLHHERDAMQFGALELFLLSLCFCRSCMVKAEERGVDAQSVKAEALNFLEHRLHHTGPGEGEQGLWQLTSFLFNHARVFGYAQSAMANVEEVLSGVRSSLTGGVELAITSATFLQPAAHAWQEGLSLDPVLWNVVDQLVLLAYFREPKDVYDEIQFVLDSTGGRPERLMLAQSLFPSESPALDNVLAKVAIARDLGLDKISFYNYGFLPEERLRWLEVISRIAG